MGLARKVILLAALLGGAAYFLYQPVPKGYSPRTDVQLKIGLAGKKASEYLALAGQLVGYDSYLSIYRTLVAMQMKAGKSHKDDDDGIETRDVKLGGVPARLYEPSHRKAGVPLPGVVFYHGGGWAFCDVDTYDSLTRSLSKLTNSVVVSVNYRLAPEHVFPAGFEDCVTATKHFVQHAKDFNIDPTRVAVAGDSAGGNLAAAVALKLRDDDFKPPLKLQVLIYPTLQAVNLRLPSMLQNALGPDVTPLAVAQFYSLYLGVSSRNQSALWVNNDHVTPSVKQKLATTFLNVANLPAKYLEHYEAVNLESGDKKVWAEIKDKLLNPYLSPLVASKVDRLPATLVWTAEHDGLRDEGFLYAHRLREAGNHVTHLNYDIGFHGVFTLGLDTPEIHDEWMKIVQYIVKHL